MPIIDKQIEAFLEEITKKYIQRGQLPSQTAIGRELKKLQERLNGSPTFRPWSVARFQQFDVVRWNEEIQLVEFDLKTLFHELVTQALGLMKRTGWAETVYRSQRGQLDRILAALNDVLFTKQNAEDHFLGFSETFTDFSKIDISESTEGVLSLAEKVALIPAAPMGTKRILMEDKIREYSQRVEVVRPARDQIISSRPAADAPFKNIFHDMSVIWRHDVVTQRDSGVEIQAVFPIDQKTGPYRITRAAITPTSETKMSCKILYSNDGENFILLPIKEEWLVLDRMSNEVAVDFEGVTARWIKIILKKDYADEETGQGYRYSFGIKNFSLYEANRLPQATYQTVVMTPAFGLVEKVAIEVEDWIPGGTEIDYYVSGLSGEFLPIAPVDRADPQAPRVVRFGDMYEVWARFDGAGELAYVYNALNFYRINAEPVSGDYHFGMSQLYRGKWAWARETNVIEEIQAARDVYIDFASDTQKLYTYKSETVTGDLLTHPYGDQRTVIVVPSDDEIYYDRNNSGHLVRPDPTTDVDNDTEPTYAVAEVLAIRGSYTVTGETFTLSTTKWTELANRNIDENEDITLQVYRAGPDPVAGWYDFTEDSSWHMEKWPGQGDYLTGRAKMVADAYGTGVTSASARINYTIRRDVTHLVRDIVPSKGQIWLAHPVTADRFVVRYRVVPENIVRKSVVVTSSPGEEYGTLYTEGRDYKINVSSGTITRLNTNDNKIKSGGTCYVDYQWVDEKYNLETYTAWCFYDKDESTRIEFSPPDIDKDNGETFYMDINGGRVDLAEAQETPILSRGWYRFAVESAAITNSDAGIRKVLELTDIIGDPIFSGTKYFSEIRAFRQPMYQVSEPKLKFGTRKDDRSTFAIDGEGYVVVNFNPGSAEDITTLLYDPTTDALVEQDEHFELLRVRSSGKTPTGIRLRIVLRRNPNVDPGTTPKVFRWALRLSR